MIEKIKALENKLQYYESEHNNFQNQLLVQRKSFEEELKQSRTSGMNIPGLEEKESEITQLKRKVDELRNLKSAQEYTDQLIQTAKFKNLEEKLEELKQEN